MIGSVVGNYRITDKLGEGGMGAVFKGIDMMLEREVAIKVLRPEYASQPELVERFRSEAVTLAKLSHPNIATLHGFFRQGNEFFMVMEFLRGETLDSLVERNGAMPVERAITLFCQALEGIGHAHTLGIIHRDIKPANIMLTEKGAIKVMDFGIARVLGTARMTKQGSIVGTLAYMSPEQIQGMDSDARADIYSLGILLYEMLTGRVPFVNDTEFAVMMAQIQEAPPPPRTFAPHIPIAIEHAIMRSLAKKPEARFQSVAEFRAALEAGTGEAPTRIAQPQPTTPPPTRLGTDPVLVPPTMGNQMRDTRLAPPGGFPSAPPQPAYGQPVSGYGQAYAPQTQASFFSRLNWMHYAGAAVVLIVLLATPFALVSVFKQQAAQQEVAPVSRPEPAPVTAAPAPEPQPQPLPGQTLTAPIPPPTAPSTDGLQNAPVAESEAGSKSPGRNRKDAEAAAARERARKRAAEARRLLDQ